MIYFLLIRRFRRALGYVTIFFVIVVLLTITRTHRAQSEPLPLDSQRTVSWYEAHPDFMHRLLAACRNDPGHAALHPDCQNAKHAEMGEYEAQARNRLGLPVLLSPADPRFYILHPDLLQSRLNLCRQFPPAPDDERRTWCAAARTQASKLASVR